MDFDENVLSIVKRAVAKHSADIDKAVAQAEASIRRLPDGEKIRDHFFHMGVQELVYRARRTTNMAIRRETCSTPKVIVGNSESVRQIATSCYSYFIAGMALGMVMGKQLGQIADDEHERGEGHFFNERLARRLKSLVPDDKLVRQAVPEKKLRAIFASLGGGSQKPELAIAGK